jgi:hypothetical protein
MPNGNGDWYWEVLDGRTVMARGIAETEPAACQDAANEARKLKLLQE